MATVEVRQIVEPPVPRWLRPSRAAHLPLVAALIVALLPIAGPGATAQDLETAEERVEEIEARVAAATAAYEEVWAKVEQTQAELVELAQRTARLEQEAAELTASLQVRAREVFKRGQDGVISSMLSADGPADALERASLISAITSRDRSRLEAARALRERLAQARILERDRADELAALEEQMAARRDELAVDLDGAQALLVDLQQRASRQRRIDRGPQQGTYACIFERPFNFRDTWGAPRSGGRRHKGTDVFSYMDAPVYAFTSGRIHQVSNSRLGGLGLYLWGDDGNLFYYAHLNRLADDVHVGMRVDAGQHIAHNGDSGNARGGPPHVHYQLHPGGGGPVNPYPWLAAACY